MQKQIVHVRAQKTRGTIVSVSPLLLLLLLLIIIIIIIIKKNENENRIQ